VSARQELSKGAEMNNATPKVNCSVFVQTLDEEANIAACLECFKWCDDIVVLDSFSSDRTEEISRAHGARWVQHKYAGRAAHQNWAMENITFKHPWVYYNLHTDADERVPAGTGRGDHAFDLRPDAGGGRL